VYKEPARANTRDILAMSTFFDQMVTDALMVPMEAPEWLIRRIERKISSWYNKWLSIAGRLTLVKLVLEATPVY
jgi:hypothetical protein